MDFDSQVIHNYNQTYIISNQTSNGGVKQDICLDEVLSS